MTDTAPVKAPDTPLANPPSKLDEVKGFLGDMARPFAIYVTASGAAISSVTIALRVATDKIDLVAAAAFMAAIFTGVGALYGAKAWENAKIAATPTPNGSQ